MPDVPDIDAIEAELAALLEQEQRLTAEVSELRRRLAVLRKAVLPRLPRLSPSVAFVFGLFASLPVSCAVSNLTSPSVTNALP